MLFGGEVAAPGDSGVMLNRAFAVGRVGVGYALTFQARDRRRGLGVVLGPRVIDSP